MISYLVDKDNIYTKEIQKRLRAYNVAFTGETTFEQLYVYALDKDELVGFLAIHYFWDWVTIDDVFYLNQRILKEMIQEVWKNYHDKAMGIKLFTPVYERYEDFLSAGFKATGTVKPTKNTLKYYYADLNAMNIEAKQNHQIITQSEGIKAYQDIIDKHLKNFKKQNKIYGKLDDLQVIALEDNKFVGGIICEIYDETIYISHIVVDENHRKKQIGKTLMDYTEKEAKKRNLEVIELGTCEFQARYFYEKLGYKIVYTRDNNPKGFQSYTMMKII